jgi:hypothetical protein
MHGLYFDSRTWYATHTRRKGATMDCTDHRDGHCQPRKIYRVRCQDCGKRYCSEISQGFQCRSCYLLDEYHAGLL